MELFQLHCADTEKLTRAQNLTKNKAEILRKNKAEISRKNKAEISRKNKAEILKEVDLDSGDYQFCLIPSKGDKLQKMTER